MQIHGLNKTTLLEYPEHVAATVFTGGCNFCCPFCHNGDLVLHPGECPVISEEEVIAFLKKRKNMLCGVCITGGEPTLQPDLAEFIRKIKELGLLVKLDTNGYRPGVLQGLLKEKLLDYVAMDLKNSREKYALTVGKPDLEIEKLEESVDLLLHSGIVYEFRTTVVKGLHEEEDFAKMEQWIEGAEAYYLQSYRDNENVIKKGYSAFEKEELESFLQLVKPYVKKAELRGVE